MKSSIKIEANNPKELQSELSPSLDSSEKVKYELETRKDSITVKIKTKSLGALRGSTDTVFRLASLSNKIKRM